MIHKDLKKFRDRLDEILKKAKPILDLKEEIEDIRRDIRALDKDIDECVKNHPEMCDSACPECDVCPQQKDGECPKIKKDVVRLYYGNNSMFTITYLIGT